MLSARAHIDERLHRLGAVLRELTDTETVIVTALQIELHHQHMAVVQPAEIIVVVPLRNVAQQRPVDLARLRGGQLHRLARPVQTEIAAAPRAGMAARNQTLLAHLPGIEDRLQRVLELPRRVELIGTRERAAVRERIAQGDVGGVLRVILVRAPG